MAGSFLDLQLQGFSSLSTIFNQYLSQGKDLTPPLRDAGEYLLESTQQRFVDMQAPDGEPWEPLAHSTLKQKKRPDRILRESGTLADLLTYELSSSSVEVGSNMEYAATHQFGRDEIPERPFLGIAPFEEKEIITIFQDHIKG